MNEVNIERLLTKSRYNLYKFRVGDEEVSVLQVGTDIFSPRAYVFDREDKLIGEFYGRLPPSTPELNPAFREQLIEVVHRRK